MPLQMESVLLPSLLPSLFFPAAPLPSPTPSCLPAFLSGPPHCGKTSLLLQFAYNCALDRNSTVTFICKQYAFDVKPPCLSQVRMHFQKALKMISWKNPQVLSRGFRLMEGVDAESEVFARITIKYIRDAEELRKLFAAFHIQTVLPKAVIIDNFYDMFDERLCGERFGHTRARETAMVKTLALCHDAINYANEKLQPEKQCQLLVSDSHVGDTPRLRFIYQRWLPQIYTIKALDFQTYSVSAGRDQDISIREDVYAEYTMVDNRLQLEQIGRFPG